MAVSLTFPTGFKFSYSGDCRPSRDFAAIGKGTTVLLHEATFDDELKGDALAKKHSTTSEAIGVAAVMGARRVILTHFSQRYQKIPSINSMDSLSIKLEDADHSEESADAPVDEAMAVAFEAQAPINNRVESLEDAPTNPRTEMSSQDQQPPTAPQPLTKVPFTGAFSCLNNFSTLLQPPPKPTPLDMKIGVAFDYMRVKVGDIIHLEKFNPAMRELYKEAEDDEKARKAKSIAQSDNGVGDEPAKLVEERKEERAEKARKGQSKAARREQENLEKWERQKNEMNNEADEVSEREVKMRDSLTFDPSILINRVGSRDKSPGTGEDGLRRRRSPSVDRRSPSPSRVNVAGPKAESEKRTRTTPDLPASEVERQGERAVQ